MAARYERKSDLLHRRVSDGVLVAKLTDEEPFRLDGVGALLFESLETERTWSQLCTILDDVFGDVWRSESDAVAAFLAELVEIGLVEQRSAGTAGIR